MLDVRVDRFRPHVPRSGDSKYIFIREPIISLYINSPIN